jgi:protein translocase SecG subunit
LRSGASKGYNTNIMFETILSVLQIITAILLIGSILLQAPEGGISPAFGGGGEMYRSKRNIEKFLIVATIVLSVILVILSISQLVFTPQTK